MPLKFLLRLYLFFAIPSLSFAIPEHNPVPGGLALIKLATGQPQPSAFWQDKKLAIISSNNQDYVLVGIPLKTRPGQQQVTLKWPNGKTTLRTFKVKSKIYKAQYLTIKNKRKVNPYKKDMPRILKEKKIKNRAKKTWTDTQVAADFIIPVHGRISSIFGLRRFFNQQARRPHSGLDIAAAEGTPIRAIAPGRVIEAGNFFFSGNMVYLDHGQGLISLYAHMNRIDVKPGEQIQQGQIIGSVGETGRVTGPHLHLAVIANQTLVDPLLFLRELQKPE